MQMSKQKIGCLQFNCKGQNKKNDARSSTAKLKIKNLMLAVGLQRAK